MGLGQLRILFVAAMLIGEAAAVKPAVDLAERDRHAVAGETWTRTLVVSNPTTQPLALELTWKSMIDSAVIDTGTIEIKAATGETTRREIKILIPPVTRPVTMDWLAQAGDDAIRHWKFRIYPAQLGLDWQFIKAKRIGVLDPTGVWADWLTSRGASVAPLSGITDAAEFDGDLLLVQPEASEISEWEQYLSRWADRPNAAPLILLAGNSSGPKIFAARSLEKQNPDDLAGWRHDGVVGTAMPPPAGSFRRIVIPDGDTAARSLLIAIVGASGARAFVCSMPIGQKLSIEPACELMIHDLIGKALMRRPDVRSGVALIVDPDADSMLSLKRAVFGSEDATAASLESNPGAAIVDATRDVSAEQLAKIKKYVDAGGTLIVLGLSSSGDFSRWALEGAELLEAGSDEDLIRESDQFKNLMTEQEWRGLAGARVAYRLPESTKYKESTSGVMRGRSEGNGRLTLIQLDPGKMSVEQVRLILGQILFNMGVRVPSIEYRFNE